MRQTPGGRGVWEGVQFLARPTPEPCHAWFVYEELRQPETLLCPPGNTVFITAEPRAVRRYHPAFLAQFGWVVTSQREIQHPGVIRRQQGLAWHIGRVGAEHRSVRGYDELAAQVSPPDKTGQLGLLCSNSTLTDEHVRRLKFVRQLTAHFGERVDMFGIGTRPLGDKWDGIAPYRYSIVLENSSHPNYWTEKLADTFLGWSFPFYWGCPNLADYFPEGSYCYLDRDDPRGSCERIERAMADGAYEKSLPQLAEARERVLNRYNMFAEMAELVGRFPTAGARATTLLPESSFETQAGLPRRLYRDARRKARALTYGLTEFIEGFRKTR